MVGNHFCSRCVQCNCCRSRTCRNLEIKLEWWSLMVVQFLKWVLAYLRASLEVHSHRLAWKPTLKGSSYLPILPNCLGDSWIQHTSPGHMDTFVNRLEMPIGTIFPYSVTMLNTTHVSALAHPSAVEVDLVHS